MKIFLTGATGFIGQAVANRLSKTDHEIRCLVRKTSNVEGLKRINTFLVYGDVTDKDSLRNGMTGCDWVVNLANIYSFWEPDPSIYATVNIEGTRNVMQCALETGVSKVVHVSTSLTYGKPEDSPFTEKSRVGPVRFSQYARTKYTGDLIAWELYKEKGLPLVVVYPGSVIGAGDPKAYGRYIQDLIHRRLPARGFENSRFNIVYVGDVAEVILRALEKRNNIGEKYLIGKYCLSNHEINNMVTELAGVPLPRISVPNSVAIVLAALQTCRANLVNKPPLSGMALDQARTNIKGCYFDGSKVETELGITYTPIRTALEEVINSYLK